MQAISHHQLDTHTQKLRQIFSKVFEAGIAQDAIYTVAETTVPSSEGPILSLVLRGNAATEVAINDRGDEDVCAVLAARGDRRVLCSFFEKWKVINPRKLQYQFNAVSMTYYLAFPAGVTTARKQMFRLDWNDWEYSDPSKTAHPHWNFDKWLTASDRLDVLSQLRSHFGPSSDHPKPFDPNKSQQAPDRPSLAWFTRLHFPMIATCDPAIPKPHRWSPESIQQIEGWMESALSYLRAELKEYMLSPTSVA